MNNEGPLLAELRAWLDRRESESSSAGDTLQPGDLAQIKPAADKVFGGMVIRVTRVLPGKVEGYLLRPHRCGVKIGWHHHTAPELDRVGRIVHPEAKWGFQGF